MRYEEVESTISVVWGEVLARLSPADMRTKSENMERMDVVTGIGHGNLEMEMEIGNGNWKWKLEIGNGNLNMEIGIWKLEYGNWNMEMEYGNGRNCKWKWKER